MSFYKKRNYILNLLVISMFQFLLSILFIRYVNYQYIGAVYFVISSMFFILVVFKLIAINMQSELKALEQYLTDRLRYLEFNIEQKQKHLDDFFDCEFKDFNKFTEKLIISEYVNRDINKLRYSFDCLNNILLDVYKQQSKMCTNPFYIVKNDDMHVRYELIQRIYSYSAILDDQEFDFDSMYKSKCQRGDV